MVLTDVATKMIREFPLKTRIGEEVLSCIHVWVESILPNYPWGNQLLHYHALGDAELIDQKLKAHFLKQFGTTVTWSSMDTPELNAYSERKFRSLERCVLRCSLIRGYQNRFGGMHTVLHVISPVYPSTAVDGCL